MPGRRLAATGKYGNSKPCFRLRDCSDSDSKSLPSHSLRWGHYLENRCGLHDILHVLKRRDPSLPVIIYPTAVQGDDAPGRMLRLNWQYRQGA